MRAVISRSHLPSVGHVTRPNDGHTYVQCEPLRDRAPSLEPHLRRAVRLAWTALAEPQSGATFHVSRSANRGVQQASRSKHHGTVRSGLTVTPRLPAPLPLPPFPRQLYPRFVNCNCSPAARTRSGANPHHPRPPPRRPGPARIKKHLYSALCSPIRQRSRASRKG